MKEGTVEMRWRGGAESLKIPIDESEARIEAAIREKA
jgi:hypothetical protein